MVRGPFSTNVTWGATDSFAMTKDNSTGYWAVTVTNARPGQEYKYVLKRNGDTNDYWKHDPRAVWVRNGNSVIYDHAAFDWGSVTRPNIPVSQQVMYEMHIGSFYDPNPNNGRPGTFDDAIQRLDYLQRLGVNVLAVMPVNEFGGDYSWGYNPHYPYAIESAYGGPDGLKRFVKAAHQRGMKVQIDVVHNHWLEAATKPDDSVWQFDGLANPYFFSEAAKQSTSWGPRPDYDNPEVRNYIQDHIKLLLNEFKVDGLRWDSPQNILGYDSTQKGSNPNTVLSSAKSMLMAINRMIHEQYPERWSIAEDADLLTVRPAGGDYLTGSFKDLLRVDDSKDSFDGHWQTSFHNEIVPEVAKALPDATRISNKVSGWSEPPGYRIIFTENHDKSGDLNIGKDTSYPLLGWRLANRMDPSNQTVTAGQKALNRTNSIVDPTVRKKTLLNAALTFTAPGTPMLFMGQELGAIDSFSDAKTIDWRAALNQHRIFRAHRDLVSLRGTLPALQRLELSSSPAAISQDGTLMVYWRNGASPSENIVVLFNFSNQNLEISCPFPSDGKWYVHFNSDWTVYGSDFGNYGPSANEVMVNSFWGTVPLAGNSVIILALSVSSPNRIIDDVVADGIPDGWQVLAGATNSAGDNDQDGFSNLNEFLLGLDPNEANPTLVKGTLTGWGATSSIMKVNDSPDTLAYLQMTETASSGQEAKFLSPEGWFGTSTNLGTASISTPGSNIAHATLSNGYAYFTFNTSNKAYAITNFTPNLGVMDQDNDGMDDRWESWFGVSDPLADPDSDGFTNLEEFKRGSDPKAWNRPVLALAGEFNGWTPGTNRLTYSWNKKWQLDLPFKNATSGAFKFTDGSWSNSWGDNVPADGVADNPSTNNLAIQFNSGNGIYRFQIDEETLAYRVTYDPTDANFDGIQDAWVSYYGLTASSDFATADPDGDGISNLAEFRRFSSPSVVDRMSVVGNRSPLAWSPDDAPLRMNWSDVRQRWEWVGNFTAGSLAFKFASGPGWSGLNYGTGGGLAANTASATGTSDLSASLASSRYRFAFSEMTGAYSVESFPVSSEWRETNGLSLMGAWTNDTDQDGVNDLLEYALGGNPNLMADGKSLQSLSLTQATGTNRLRLEWLERNDGGSTLSVTPELATNLGGPWSSLPSSLAANQTEMPANHQRREVTTPIDSTNRKFLRLKVTGP